MTKNKDGSPDKRLNGHYTVRAKPNPKKGFNERGRRGYDREVIGHIIYNSIILNGSDKKAYETAKICNKTFYEWMNNDPNFRHMVEEARRIYSNTNSEALEAKAVQRLAENLESGRVTKRFRTNNQGLEEQVIINHGTDIAAIQMALANRQINTAIQTLTNYGYLVIDPTQQASESTGGLTDETIDMIKAKILGIENDG